MANPYERRSVPRSPVAITIRWRLRGKWTRRPQRATVINVTLAGAGIRARTDDSVSVGSFVDIYFGTGRGVASVRWVRASTEPAMSDYGIEFFEVDSRLKAVILDLIRRHRAVNA